MKTGIISKRHGYTVVELMTTVVIVSVLAASVGMFFVKLLTIQEKDREEAYIREKLTEICGAYADFLSVGTSIGTGYYGVNPVTVVNYRQEAGGVSLETNLVTRATQLKTIVTNGTVAIDIASFNRELERRISGDALLLPLKGAISNCTLTAIGTGNNPDGRLPTASGAGIVSYDNAALGLLAVTAWYEVRNKDGENVWTNATAERIVRLWNRK